MRSQFCVCRQCRVAPASDAQQNETATAAVWVLRDASPKRQRAPFGGQLAERCSKSPSACVLRANAEARRENEAWRAECRRRALSLNSLAMRSTAVDSGDGDGGGRSLPPCLSGDAHQRAIEALSALKRAVPRLADDDAFDSGGDGGGSVNARLIAASSPGYRFVCNCERRAVSCDDARLCRSAFASASIEKPTKRGDDGEEAPIWRRHCDTAAEATTSDRHENQRSSSSANLAAVDLSAPCTCRAASTPPPHQHRRQHRDLSIESNRQTKKKKRRTFRDFFCGFAGGANAKMHRTSKQKHNVLDSR